jgi:predicted enzyme related to lactoylglutathione lyase
MFLENLCMDALDPRRLGRFWEQALGTTNLTDEPGEFETRLTVQDGPVLDLCLQRVDQPSTAPPRLHLDLYGGARQAELVERLIGLGAVPADIGQGDVPWVVLADPEGHPFCVMEDRAAYRDTGPVAAVPVLVADPEAGASFWSELTGWQVCEGSAPASLRHPSGRGLVLEFLGEDEPKRGKNRMHLDVRLQPGDDAEAVLAHVQELGAVRVDHQWGDLPWTVLADPSGNEFCILPARAA